MTLGGKADLRFHHVGIACKSVDRDEPGYLQLGFEREGERFADPIQRVSGLFLRRGDYRVELLEPLVRGEASPLDPFLSRGIKLYHQAFETDDLQLSSDCLVAEGAMVSVPPVAAIAFSGRLITFLMLRSMTLVELIQAPIG